MYLAARGRRKVGRCNTLSPALMQKIENIPNDGMNLTKELTEKMPTDFLQLRVVSHN